MSMSNQKLSIKLETKDSVLTIYMSGQIEDQFSKFALQLGAIVGKFETIQFDLGQVTFINSSGIREWIKMLIILNRTRTVFFNCPVFMIQQANLVDGFFNTNSEIASFFVPYYSESANQETQVLYEKGKDYDTHFINIPDVVSENEVEYKIDAIREKFFSFLGAKK